MKDYRHMVLGGTILLAVALFAMAEDDPQIGDKPLSALLKQLTGENRGFQMRAARALSEAPTNARPQIIEQVLPVLKSPRENDKFVAAQVLGGYGPIARAAVPDLLPMLGGTQYERNRAAAAKALGQILHDAQPSDETEKAVGALVAVFGDQYLDVRREAVRACGMIGPAAKSCIPKLETPLTEQWQWQDSGMVHQQAAWTCGRMGPLAAVHIDRLISMLHGEGGKYPEIVQAIGCIGPVHENVIPNVVDKLASDNDWEPICRHIQTYEALRKFGPKAALAVPVVARLLKAGRVHYAHVPAALRVFEAVGPAAKEALPVVEYFQTVKEYRGGSREWNDNPSTKQMDDMRQTAKEVAAALAGQKPPDGTTAKPADKAP